MSEEPPKPSLALVDEVGSKRRERAGIGNDLVPRDALIDALTLVRDCQCSTIDHAFVIVAVTLDDGSRGFHTFSGGNRHDDEVLGLLTRAGHDIINRSMTP